MTIPAYPDYEASEQSLEFEIPSHWTHTKARFAFDFGRGLTITKENLLDEGVPCVSYGEVHSKYGFQVNPETDKLRCVDDSYLKSSPYALLNKGDIVFADTSEDIDGAGNFTQLLSNSLIFAGYHTIIARPSQNHAERFLAYLLDSQEFRSQIRLSVKGVKVFSVTQAILKSAALWLPPVYEQTQIARFLDHETAKIDALIAEQKRLIKLLQEKRQAVISHAVTKGLDPNVPMKDSGVEWLGEVPAHWEVRKLKYCASLVTTKGASRENVISLENIEGGTGRFISTVSEFSGEGVIFEPQDVLFGKLRPYLAKVHLARTSGIALGDILVFRATEEFAPEFLFFMLISQGFIDEVNQSSYGTKMPRANPAYILGLFVTAPPREEQLEIANYLVNAQYDKILPTILNANRLMKLLEERRSALISAAVTGKIDVRDWQPPADENAFDEEVQKAGLEASA